MVSAVGFFLGNNGQWFRFFHGVTYVRGFRSGVGGRGCRGDLFGKEGQAIIGIPAGDPQSRVLPERPRVLVLVGGEQDDV